MYAKAQIVDRKALSKAQAKGDITGAETILKAAYETDVTKALQQWRRTNKLPKDPLAELRNSGVIARLGRERTKARQERGEVQSASYA